MTLWLYAVRPAACVLKASTGAAGGPLHAFEAEGLQVVYEVSEAARDVTRERVLAYGEVLQRLCATRAALPFRYGATVPTDHTLLDLLRARADEWTRRLEAIRGQCEFIVHVAGPPSPAPTARTGTAYLTARAETLHRAASLGESLSTALAPVCTDVRQLPAPTGTARLACLASPERAGELRARLDQWHSARPLESPRVTGPWPPFSFADEVTSQ